MRQPVLRIVLAALATALAAPVAVAADSPKVTIFDIHLGMSAAQMPAEDLVEPACGTNGGPPGIPLSGFDNFRICPAEENGLREVTFIYDDEQAYRAKARRDLIALQNVDGTRVLDQPVIVSVLFDNAGIIQGIRIVTDPKALAQTRFNAFQLRIHYKARYGEDGWSCADLPPAAGETPIGQMFVKERCRKQLPDGTDVILQSNFFHKAGQSAFDPFTQAPTPLFESSCRLELWSRAAAATRVTPASG